MSSKTGWGGEQRSPELHHDTDAFRRCGRGRAIIICGDAQMTSISRQRSRRSAQYPLGSIAPYGPDNTLATKLVVTVLERPGQREPGAMRTWTTQAVDVRHDPTIAADVAVLREYGVKHTVTSDRIMGCPHQEGIDYPMGRNCPRCPFWAGIDRFTHEPIRVPTPTLSPAEILTTLSREASAQPAERETARRTGAIVPSAGESWPERALSMRERQEIQEMLRKLS